jgi:hypothetical protein
MESVPLTIGCVPLAIYLFVLAWINLRRQATVVSGVADIALLAIAIAGLAIVGPINLFLPASAAVRFGPSVWLLLLCFYGLCVLLYALVARPRLIVFNITPQQLRPVLEQVARRLDSDARFAGDATDLPQLSVQFHLDSSTAWRNISLVATGDRQSYSGWKRLHMELIAALRGVDVARNPRGFTFLACALVLFIWPTLQLMQTPNPAVARQLRDLLRM